MRIVTGILAVIGEFTVVCFIFLMIFVLIQLRNEAKNEEETGTK